MTSVRAVALLSLLLGGLACATTGTCSPTTGPAAGYLGVCMDTSCCTGGFDTSGLCTGGASNQCCSLPTCTTPSGTGSCMDSSLCTGNSVSGFCSGPSNIQCCIPASCTTPAGTGVCVPTSKCSGTRYSGSCAGGNDIQCCVTGGGPTPPTPAPGSYKGVDVAGTTTSAEWNCLKGAGYNFAIVRAWHSNGVADTTACPSIQAAHAAGFASVDVYMFPCPLCSASPQTQLANMINSLKSSTNGQCTPVSGTQGSKNFGKVWLDIEQQSPYWSSSTSTNQAFFAGLIAECNTLGLSCGVYSSASQWTPIMGSSTAGSAYPLWYAHYDNNPSFGDFNAFGGWTNPYMKQYQGCQTICGVGEDLNWTPNRQPAGVVGGVGPQPPSPASNDTSTESSSEPLNMSDAATLTLSGMVFLGWLVFA